MTWTSQARERIAEAAASYVHRREGSEVATPWSVRAAVDRPLPTEPGEEEPAFPRGSPAVVGHYRNGYILAQDEEGLILVDQHAAHERILYEQIASSESFTGSGPPVQALLFPRSVSLPPAARAFPGDIVAELSSLGFDVESFGDDTVIVRGVPAPLGESDPAQLVLELLSDPGEEGSRPPGIEGRRHRMLATAACHAAVKVPAQLTPEKIAWILERLLACGSPLRCPHGRPTMLRWAHRAIERRFGRP
jgi:DNA mismatch repair protein MutL